MTQPFNNKRLYDHICNEAIVAQIQSINTQYGILDKTVPGTEVTWGTIIGNIEDQTDLVNFVNELVEKVIEGDIDIDLSKYALKTDLQTLQAQVDAIKVPTKVSELQNDAGYLTQHQDISNLVTKSELELKADKTQLTDYALKTDVVSPDQLTNYPTKQELDIAVDTKADIAELNQVQGNVDTLDVELDKVKAVTDNAVQYSLYDNRKFIQLANHDALSGVSTTGDGANLIMMSKWDKVDIGTSKYPCNLNAIDGIVTINDDLTIATTKDVEDAKVDISGLATKEELNTGLAGKANTKHTHAITEVTDLQSVLDGKQPVGNYPVYLNYGTVEEPRLSLELKNHDSISGLDTTGFGHNIAMVSQWDVADFGATGLHMNLNTKDNVTINDDKVVATTDDVEEVKDLTPIMVNIPIRTNATFKNVQTKETILGWFGCTTDAELKRLILGNRPMFLKYGIQLSGNPYYYKMPIQYIAYESANQIKMVLIGLNTNDDAASKYEILMNLDGTVIENNSNVKMTITPLILETKYNELEAKYTALEARVAALEQPSA